MDIKKLLKEYIENNLQDNKVFERCCVKATFNYYQDINSFINDNQDDNKFQKLLFKYIDRTNKKDSEIYNKAYIDRRLFSKIRSDETYHPSKDTIIRLGLALELNEDEIISLLESASYSLPKNNLFDLIIRFSFINKIYDINNVNDLLYEYKCKLLN